MSTYARLAELPLQVESLALAGLERDVSSDFTRLSTEVHLRGGGHEGTGEDVTWGELDQIAFRDEGKGLDVTGTYTIDTFSEMVSGLDLWAAPPEIEVWAAYRRWAFESAALDLALRQAGRSFQGVLGREPRPVRFVVSLRLGEEPTAEPVRRWLALDPDLRFKLDATPQWDDALMVELAATGAVDSVDFKGAYHGTSVDQPGDAALYARVAAAFPEAWLEDPDLRDAGCARALESHHDRITWDAPIHSVGDIEALAFTPRMVNLKPSRFGSLRELCAAYDHCAERGLGAYGGGQFELGTGRPQIQHLASLFHPDAPNDVAPGGYNDPEPSADLPRSPLAPRPASAGF